MLKLYQVKLNEEYGNPVAWLVLGANHAVCQNQNPIGTQELRFLKCGICRYN